jgi:hypothetical protein
MSGMMQVYTFKCSKGHVTHIIFKPGTRIDDEDETTCRECMKKNVLEPAYVVFVRPETDKERADGKRKA